MTTEHKRTDMARGKRIYVLTDQIKNKILKASAITIRKQIAGKVFLIRGRLRAIHCRRCNKEIAIGEAVLGTRARRRQNLYHVNCAAAVNLLWYIVCPRFASFLSHSNNGKALDTESFHSMQQECAYPLNICFFPCSSTLPHY